jgi:hypothetical protein
MMSTCCSKHLEEWNKYIKKEGVKLVVNQNDMQCHLQKIQLNIFFKITDQNCYVHYNLFFPWIFRADMLIIVCY